MLGCEMLKALLPGYPIIHVNVNNQLLSTLESGLSVPVTAKSHHPLCHYFHVFFPKTT